MGKTSIVENNLPEYTLRRTNRRRSVALMLLPDGSLEVRAPKRVSQNFIEEFIAERMAWVERKKAEQQVRPKAPKRSWQDGDIFYIEGAPYTLKVKQANRVYVERDGETLTLYQKDPTNAKRVRENLMGWFKAEAERVFKPRLARHANSMEEAVPKLIISTAKQRWGSCQGKKRVVRLSFRLLMASKDVQDYVMIHELAHLKHMDHSKAFWARVEAFYPHWEAMEQRLKHNAGLWTFD